MQKISFSTFPMDISTWIHLCQRIEEQYPYAEMSILMQEARMLLYVPSQEWTEQDKAFFEMLANTNLIASWMAYPQK
jgi:hypothetical protein